MFSASKEELFVVSALVGGITVLSIWKKRFLVDFVLRKEEREQRNKSPMLAKGTRYGSTNEVLTNIINNHHHQDQQQQQNNEVMSNNNNSNSNRIHQNGNSGSGLLLSSTRTGRGSSRTALATSAADKSLSSSYHDENTSKTPLTIGNNDGSAFALNERIPSLFGSSSSSSSNSLESNNNDNKLSAAKTTSSSSPPPAVVVPGFYSSALLLMKGIDVSDTFTPSVPHRHVPQRSWGPGGV